MLKVNCWKKQLVRITYKFKMKVQIFHQQRLAEPKEDDFTKFIEEHDVKKGGKLN